MSPPRPGSRASAAVRRYLKQHGVPVSTVYGDTDLVTVIYPAPLDSADEREAAGYHTDWMDACLMVLQEFAAAEHKPDPETLRGVCHLEEVEAPVVWLVRREWALALGRGDLDTRDTLEKIVATSATLSLDGQERAAAGGA
jgi:hypothetical protein